MIKKIWIVLFCNLFLFTSRWCDRVQPTELAKLRQNQYTTFSSRSANTLTEFICSPKPFIVTSIKGGSVQMDIKESNLTFSSEKMEQNTD